MKFDVADRRRYYGQRILDSSCIGLVDLMVQYSVLLNVQDHTAMMNRVFELQEVDTQASVVEEVDFLFRASHNCKFEIQEAVVEKQVLAEVQFVVFDLYLPFHGLVVQPLHVLFAWCIDLDASFLLV